MKIHIAAAVCRLHASQQLDKEYLQGRCGALTHQSDNVVEVARKYARVLVSSRFYAGLDFSAVLGLAWAYEYSRGTFKETYMGPLWGLVH